MTILDQLKRDEGFSAVIYTDTTGNPTIGYGTNLAQGIAEDEASAILEIRVNKAIATLASRLPYFSLLDPVRQGVLTNMCYNLGFNRLEEFHNMLVAVANGDWATAASEMLDSLWAKQVGLRAQHLAQQMVSGEWV